MAWEKSDQISKLNVGVDKPNLSIDWESLCRIANAYSRRKITIFFAYWTMCQVTVATSLQIQSNYYSSNFVWLQLWLNVSASGHVVKKMTKQDQKWGHSAFSTFVSEKYVSDVKSRPTFPSSFRPLPPTTTRPGSNPRPPAVRRRNLFKSSSPGRSRFPSIFAFVFVHLTPHS
jgi:hypothetical protein